MGVYAVISLLVPSFDCGVGQLRISVRWKSANSRGANHNTSAVPIKEQPKPRAKSTSAPYAVSMCILVRRLA